MKLCAAARSEYVLNIYIYRTLKNIQMKKISFSVVILCLFASSQQTIGANVVFNVTVPIHTNQCWIVGNYNVWNNNLNQCTKVDSTHFSITLDEANFVSGVTIDNMQYKYCCGGGDWAYVEKKADGTESDIRKYADSNGNDVVQRWAAVYYVNLPMPMNITIHTLTPAGTKACYIVGNFNYWVGPTAPADSCKMKLVEIRPDNTVLFEKTIYTFDANKLLYHFCSGPDWSYEQKFPTGDFSYPETTPVVNEWKAVYDPSKTGTIKINATVPAGTKKVWILGNFLGWDLSKAVEGTKNANGTFSFLVSNVMSIDYRLYNQLDWAYDEIDPSTGQEMNVRTATYPADSVTNITVSQWRNVTDNIAPTAPTNLKVTSINTNTFYLSWQAATDNTGVNGYEVYKDDILYGTSTSLGLNISGLTACETKMTVKAKDNAGNLSVNSLPVFVSQLIANAGTDKSGICGSTVQLTSTATKYGGTGTLKYKWTPSTGLNNDTLPNPTVTLTGDMSYVMKITTPNGCTGSDTVAVRITPMAKPEIGIVGIINNKNRVVWNKLVSTGISAYNIYKETTVSDVYEKVGNVSNDSLSVFVDNQSAPNVKSNKYKLSVIDKSGLESPQSNAHKTMHLSINKGQNNTWNLIWEPYEGFTVSTYNIYSGTSLNSLNFLDATSGSSTQYSDISASAGDVYYQLEVISPTLVSPTKVSATSQRTKETESTLSTALVSYSSSRSNVATNVLSGISQISDEMNICIYPNPVKDEFRINFEGCSKFDIVDLMGVVVLKGDLHESNIVSTSGLTQGVYLLRFIKANSTLTKKFIKM